MYYIVLAMFAKVRYVARPQGSDILIKPYNSKIYRYFTIKSLKAATAVIVDSLVMKEEITKLSLNSVTAVVVPNGIDIEAIQRCGISATAAEIVREKVLSVRGYTSLYRIKEILIARNFSKDSSHQPIHFVYPFYEAAYKQQAASLLLNRDVDLGSVTKPSLYNLMKTSFLVFSIPSSDSFPRSVFEAVFCGCAVAITYSSYYDRLPQVLKSRFILIDLARHDWFDVAIVEARRIVSTPFEPSIKILNQFDQKYSFRKMANFLN
jgi:glycosyltransferase involved in cell wall biosynthesis